MQEDHVLAELRLAQLRNDHAVASAARSEKAPADSE